MKTIYSTGNLASGASSKKTDNSLKNGKITYLAEIKG